METHRLIGRVLISEPEVGRLDEVEVLEDVVQEILAGGLLLDLLDQLLLVQKDDLDVEGLGASEAGQQPHLRAEFSEKVGVQDLLFGKYVILLSLRDCGMFRQPLVSQLRCFMNELAEY